jgi:3-isopropylmalate/(R)-2-methylmalate dehydratase large subunit
VRAAEGEPALLYIDLHLIHEVTSPQAFEGLRAAGRSVRRPDLTIGTIDHNVPTTDRSLPIVDSIAEKQMALLRSNCREFGISLFDIDSDEQGIVHVIGPELGFTQPGMTIVCGDSHKSTHGAFGALAFGIGTSEVEHVLATQCLQNKPRTMLIDARPPAGLRPKISPWELLARSVLTVTGYVIEYAGGKNLSMEGRMTLCNMSIEANLAGMIALTPPPCISKGKRFSPAAALWNDAVGTGRL